MTARIGLRASAFAFALAGLLSGGAAQASGPGLPNLTYSSAEVGKPLSTIKSDVSGAARGHGTVQMFDGYLFVPFGVDSGNPGGGFSFYNISNPRAPVKVSQTNNSGLREPHGFGFSFSYPGRYAVMQATTGIQFWDFTNPLAPALLKALTLPGISASDYASGAWWVFWQAPYVYVGGSGNGLLIVDATDPRNPVYKKTVPTSAWGNFRVGPVFAVGNLLVLTSMDRTGLATMDISDPLNPKLLASTTSTAGHYSGIVNGERIITAGTDQRLHIYNISNPSSITQTLQSPDIGGKGGYVSIQGNFAHAGFSTKYAKVDLSTGAIVTTGTSNIGDRDEDFGTVFGNLVLIGNDHPTGSVIVPHQTGQDNTGPSVNMVSPKNNATNQVSTSRVGITFTDQPDLRTVNSNTFIVRPLGGAALPGKYSGQSGIVNFWPDTPLAAGTTYEVVIPAGGIRDDVGNAVPTTFTSRFTTGGAVVVACTLDTPRTPALVGSSVSFTPESASGNNLQYSWNFGDGSSTAFSSTPGANHAYANPGHYPVILSVRSGTTTSTCSANQTIHTQPTATAPRSSSTIAYDALRNRVWVVNSDSDTVTAINAATNTKLFEVPVGINPQTLAQAPDGRIWVANHGSATLSILDPSSGALAQTINLAPGSKPFGVAFNPLGTAAYVSLQGTGSLLKLSPSTGAVQGSVNVGPTPRGIAVTGDSARIFVTRYISPADRGEIVEVNPSAFVVTRTFALATDPGPDTEASGRGVPNFISSIAIHPDGKRAWIPSKKDNTLRGLFRDGQALSFESTVRTIVSQIDLDTSTEALANRIDFNDRDMANAVLFSPLGDLAFVSTQGTNEIEVVDAYNRQINTGIVLNNGRAPRGLLLTPNGRLYVQNFMSRSVTVFDVSGLLNSTGNAASQVADISTVAGETLSAQVLNGKKIFYNANDRRMNRDKYISCASCHQDGGQDGRVMDFTDRGEGLRNTVTLNGRRGTGHGRVHWSANFNEIQDFEHDMRNAFGGTGFLTDAQFNTGTRNQPLGDPKAGLNADLDALAAYVTSLSTVGRSPFRNADGSLTADAVLGQQIFQGSGQCASCHSGSDFTDSASGVLHDVGTIKASSGKRLGGPLTGIDTPTLKGVWETAPYLHDGSAATLLDVMTTANPLGKHGVVAGLSAAQLQQLVAYMQQIDDNSGTPPALVVSNLSVKDTANAADWSLRANLQVGNQQYGDRSFTLTTIPATLVGSQWIRTANDSKAFTANPTVTFSINRSADVYVAVDTRVPPLSWMTGWTNTGTSLVNSESTPKTFTLFRKNFPAGSVSLGPSTTAGSMYTVIVK